MLKINNITIKNFLSVGAVTQSIKFDGKGLTLILGENLDQGGNGARNGVGKSTILQALSYVLYDSGITQIKKDNLINKTNGKNLLVSVDFQVGENRFRVERGRRPNIFKFFINGVESDDKDEAQGENRKTQEELNKVLGMSHDMFKHIVALSTYTQPFLFMRQNDQRAIIEELLGITQLSEKADVLKKQLRGTKESIKEEEVRIRTVIDSNNGIERSIKQLENKSAKFIRDKENNIEEYKKAIDKLEHINIDEELALHKELEKFNSKSKELKQYKRYLRDYENNIVDLGTRIENAESDLKRTEEHECPTCGQELHDVNHEQIISDIKNQITVLNEKLEPVEKEYEKYKKKVEEIGDIGEEPEPFYDDVSDAYDHKQNLSQLRHQLKEEKKKTNPYEDQITSLKNEAIQPVDYANLNELKTLLEHQEFLFKLLTSKDSFIRKKIIDQNLAYLNARLSYYLTRMNLPHNVEFKNDLTVEIVLLGQDFDFGQLSRGQQNRLILALSWAFRDVWESTGHPINLMFIDEMIDSGLDTVGVENTLEILKKQTRENGKDVFLISHKEELINRVHDVMMVIMENGFTSYNYDDGNELAA